MWSPLSTTIIWVVLSFILPSNCNWNDPNSDQFHIQTDEGPERYFRYQTQSGQYRKEKRLQDGTVIGSYGWIDSDGFLRLRDYIADNAGYRILRTKNVYVGRNEPISKAIKTAKKVPSSAGILTNNNLVPVVSTEKPFVSTTILPPVRYSTTASPVVLEGVQVSTPRTVIISPKPHGYISSTPRYDFVSSVAPPISSNSLDVPEENNYVVHNGPTYPIDRHGNSYLGYNLGNGYDPQYPQYDGVSVTNDGFRYYIPRAYHEEANVGGNKKAGSFGYIDPFGIRRVIYYNAGPEGFKHRKNNRYVGFAATPYDPRPY